MLQFYIPEVDEVEQVRDLENPNHGHYNIARDILSGIGFERLTALLIQVSCICAGNG